MAEYLLRPMAGGRLPLVVCALAVIASSGRRDSRGRRGVWLAVATFAPFALFACFMLDPYSDASLLDVVCVSVGTARGARRGGARQAIRTLVIHRAGCAPGCSLRRAASIGRSRPSRKCGARIRPTYAAMQWLRTRVPTHGAGAGCMAHSSRSRGYELADRDLHRANDFHELPRVGVGASDFFATEGMVIGARGHVQTGE